MNVPHPPVTISEKASAVVQWNNLADEAERGATLGLIHPNTAEVQARVYRATARAIQHEIDTGIAVCSCCFKPFGQGSSVLIRN
ncbi:hypothetical protein [Bordetella genomosp. 11]|uniref:Uncharacterized protein n=1 Tax=Bordetella genomosp. 11 TaxID=1416808 RepID=A0A261UDC3_9BORD|nr:hypothetical protein [Bordetella genomosp. 11]OZI59919.1 hypothetical protein CAL28_10545 [Bordetella genomosp. 11]